MRIREKTFKSNLVLESKGLYEPFGDWVGAVSNCTVGMFRWRILTQFPKQPRNRRPFKQAMTSRSPVPQCNLTQHRSSHAQQPNSPQTPVALSYHVLWLTLLLSSLLQSLSFPLPILPFLSSSQHKEAPKTTTHLALRSRVVGKIWPHFKPVFILIWFRIFNDSSFSLGFQRS